MKKIWGSDLPTDGKKFLWWVLQDGLFTGSRARRIGKRDEIYGFCKIVVESVLHIFSTCCKARVSWDSTTCYHDKNTGVGASMVDGSLVGLLDGALASRPVVVACLSMISQMVWELWLIRNNLVF